MLLIVLWVLTLVLWPSTLRLAAVHPGSHGLVCGLLHHLLPGLPCSAARHVQRSPLLLHRPLSGIRRCVNNFKIIQIYRLCLFIAGMNNELMWWDESIWSETFYCSPAGFTAFAACLIFTLHRKDILNDTRDLRKGHFGYCFVLAWICVPLLFISAFLYAHLRKRQWEESFGSQWYSVGRLRINEWLWKSHSSLYFQTFPHVQQSEDWRRTFCHHWGISVCGTSSFCPVVITPPDQERNKVVTAQTFTGLMPYIDNVLVTPAV